MNERIKWKTRTQDFSGNAGEVRLLLRTMEVHEAEKAMELQRRVWSAMPDPSLLAETSIEEIRESAQLDICIGAFEGERLAAFSLMVVNRESESRNAGQKNGHDPKLCVTFDTVFVDPDYRGLGLQKYLFHCQMEIAAGLGAHYAFATVAPSNVHSLNNMLACGFKILDRKLLYGNRDRYIMRLDINK